MNEVVNMNKDGTGQQLASTYDSAGIIEDSVVSFNRAYTNVPVEEVPTKADLSSYGLWINIGLFVIVFVLLYFIYNKVNSIKWHIQEITKKVADQNNSIVKLNKTIDTLKGRLDKFEHNVETKSASNIQDYIPNERKKGKHNIVEPSGIELSNPEPMRQSPHVIRYATLQAPDANGILRFAERSMTENPSDQKMFEVELDTDAGTGTYKINQVANSLLLSDLQQLRGFVEPFTINGNTLNRRIIDVKPGKIHQDGKFWIVDELAIIKIV